MLALKRITKQRVQDQDQKKWKLQLVLKEIFKIYLLNHNAIILNQKLS